MLATSAYFDLAAGKVQMATPELDEGAIMISIGDLMSSGFGATRMRLTATVTATQRATWPQS